MDRIAEDLFCCTCLQQMPQMEHANTVGNIFDHRKIMGNKQICRSGFLLNILHQVHHLCLNGHIQCGNTLVCDDEFRIHDQGPGNAHTLSLSTGKLMRITAGMLRCQSYLCQNILYFFCTFRAVHVCMVNIQTLADDVTDLFSGI